MAAGAANMIFCLQAGAAEEAEVERRDASQEQRASETR